MDKKAYIQPEVKVIEVMATQMMAASNINVVNGQSGSQQLGREHSGNWDDIW